MLWKHVKLPKNYENKFNSNFLKIPKFRKKKGVEENAHCN